MKHIVPVVVTGLLLACGRSSPVELGTLREAATPRGPVPNSVQQAYTPGTVDQPSSSLAGYTGPMLTLQAADVGNTAAEPTIGVASDGTAYFAASVLNIDTAATWGITRTDARRSTDGGLTWTSIQPNIAGVATPPANADPLIYLDPATDRIFVFDLLGACQWLSYSDDKGASWISNPLGCGNLPVDHQTLVAVKPTGPVPTVGYPNIMVWCTNRIADAACGRSFDGGLTWTPGGQPFLGVTEGGEVCSSLAGHLAADPDGRLFLPTGHCGIPELAISVDAGLTWTQVTIADMPTPVTHTGVTADTAGNLYYVWIDEKQKPYLSYSKDHGQTWSAPMMVAPPGVRKANFPVVAARSPGAVAISFPSNANDPAATRPPRPQAWDLTVTVSSDVFAASPVFVSATANDPAAPIHRGDCQGRCAGLWDFMDIEISAAGEAWAAASNDCAGDCLSKGRAVSTHIGRGIAVRQIGGPKL